MWKLVTDLKPEKQGPMVFLSLSPKIRQACSALSKDELKKDDGLDKLIVKLPELYGVSNEQATFSAYEKFETFQWSEGMNIIEKNDLILIMTPEKQDKTLELSKHWSVDSTPARNEVIMKRTYPVKSVKCDKICSNY